MQIPILFIRIEDLCLYGRTIYLVPADRILPFLLKASLDFPDLIVHKRLHPLDHDYEIIAQMIHVPVVAIVRYGIVEGRKHPVFLGMSEFNDLDITGLAVLIGRIIGNIDLILLFPVPRSSL